MLPAVLGAVGTAVGMGLNYQQGEKNREQQSNQAAQNIALQKEFAQNGISWKVEDAKRAGIHPLYALGANTTSFSPVSVGSSSTDFSGLGEMGQNIGRAIDATRPTSDKTAAVLQTALAQTQLDGLKLDNDIKRAKLASAVATNRTPVGMPAPGNAGTFDGQGNVPTIDGPEFEIKTKRDVTDPHAVSNVPGSGPSVAFIKNAFGGYDPVMPPEIAESMESDLTGRYKWQFQNRIMPNFTWDMIKPNIPHKPDEEVYFSTKTQDWRIRKKVYGPFQTNSRSFYGQAR